MRPGAGPGVHSCLTCLVHNMHNMGIIYIPTNHYPLSHAYSNVGIYLQITPVRYLFVARAAPCQKRVAMQP